MRFPVSARVTGFDYTTHHAYTTEVAVDGRSWSLALRYNAFFGFYSKLLEVEPQFKAPFPPKGGIFFSPQPEERQVQLDDFLQNTLTFFDLRGRPESMGALLDDLLAISEHLAAPDKAEGEVEAPTEGEKKDQEAVAMGGLLNSKWAKALVAAAMQAVVVNTFQETAEAGKAKAKAAEATAEEAKALKPAKSVDAVDMDTPSTPTSRASLTKTPRQSATVAPLEVASPFNVKSEATTEPKPKPEVEVPAKTEAKPKLQVDTRMSAKTDRAPVVVANSSTPGVRDRIAVWERRVSSPQQPTPRSAGRRSSSCSSAGDQAPVVPFSVADAPKPVVEASKAVVEQPKTVVEQPKTVVEEVKTVVEEPKPVVEEVKAVEEEPKPVAETPLPVAEVQKKEEQAVEVTKTMEAPAEVETPKEEAVESPEAEKTADAKEPAAGGENKAVEVGSETVAQPETVEEEAKAESDGYETDASDDIRRLGLEKVDVNERLRPYRHPVFFRGFYCQVRRSSIAEEPSRA